MKLAVSGFLAVVSVCLGSASLVQGAVVEINHLHDDAHYFLALKQSEAVKFSTGASRYYLISKRAGRVCKSLGYKGISDQPTPFVLKTYSGDAGELEVINSQYQAVSSSEFPDDIVSAKYFAEEYLAGVNRLLPGSTIEAFNRGTYRFSKLICETR